MSRRADYLLALSCALTKDRSMSSMDALRVMERVMDLPEEAFPPVQARDVLATIRHFSEGDSAPEWVVVARENRTRRLDLVRATNTYGSPQWWGNAKVIYDQGCIPESAIPLFVSFEAFATMTRDDFERLCEWARTVPGEEDGECPFVEVQPIE